VVLEAEIRHQVVEMESPVVRVVVAVKEIRLLELERQTKVLPVAQQTLLAAAVAVERVLLAQTEQVATPALVEMA